LSDNSHCKTFILQSERKPSPLNFTFHSSHPRIVRHTDISTFLSDYNIP
jgi:hypothetical protein